MNATQISNDTLRTMNVALAQIARECIAVKDAFDSCDDPTENDAAAFVTGIEHATRTLARTLAPIVGEHTDPGSAWETIKDLECNANTELSDAVWAGMPRKISRFATAIGLFSQAQALIAAIDDCAQDAGVDL